MRSLQRRIAAVTDSTDKLVSQLRELDHLREQVRKALLLTKRTPHLKRRNRKSTAPRAFSKRPTARLSARLIADTAGVPARTP